MAKLDEAPILALGVNPIPGGAPAGADVADDEQYIFVAAEVAKLGRIEAGAPDWYQTEQQATNILRSKSKDLEVATALGLALFTRVGYAGLAATLGLIHGLINNFWDGLFPERPRRRKVLVEALGDRFTDGGWFREHAPKPDDFDAIDLCVTRCEEIKTALTAKMPDEPPELSKFQRGLKELAGRRPKAAEPAAAAAPAGAGPGAAPAAGGEAFSGAAVADAGGAINAMLSAATFLRKADATDPVPYSVVRVLKWSRISLPTTDAAKYQIEPPDKATVEALAHQMANNLWEHLLKGAEAAFRSSDPLWLDLQRYTCAALAGMGPPYEKARQAVMSTTAGLVRRLGEGVFELKFRGGMPLTSGETKMWIESEVAPRQSAGPAGGGGMSNGKLTEAADKARKLAGTGQLKEALAALREGLTSCAQRRDRFLWRLQIAQLLFESQRLQLAAPLLEECYAEIQQYKIDDWEPTLAVEVAKTLYRCRKALTAGEKAPAPESLRGVRESFAWLCQLDPLAALAAEPSGN